MREIVRGLIVVLMMLAAGGCAATREVRVRVVDATGKGVAGVQVATAYSGYAVTVNAETPPRAQAVTDARGEAVIPVAVDWPLAASVEVALVEGTVRFDRRRGEFDEKTREIEVRMGQASIVWHKAAMILNGPPRVEGEDLSQEDGERVRDAVQRVTKGSVHLVKGSAPGEAEAYLMVPRGETAPVQWQVFRVKTNWWGWEVVERERAVRRVVGK